MKHLCIFLLVFNMGLNAAVLSQNQRVSVKLKNAGYRGFDRGDQESV